MVNADTLLNWMQTSGLDVPKQQLNLIEPKKVERKRKQADEATLDLVAKPALPKVTFDREERKITYEQSKTHLTEWEPLVEEIKHTKQLQFPLNPQNVNSITNASLVSQFKPHTGLESTINDLLCASAMGSESALQKKEREELFSLSKAERRKKFAKLSKQRSLLFYQEQKLKKLAKIKSKSFHRVLKKEDRKKSQVQAKLEEERDIANAASGLESNIFQAAQAEAETEDSDSDISIKSSGEPVTAVAAASEDVSSDTFIINLTNNVANGAHNVVFGSTPKEKSSNEVLTKVARGKKADKSTLGSNERTTNPKVSKSEQESSRDTVNVLEMAFEEDDVFDNEFSKEKQQLVADSIPKFENETDRMPGWGRWVREEEEDGFDEVKYLQSLSKSARKRYLGRKAAEAEKSLAKKRDYDRLRKLIADSRKDSKLQHVIINEKRDKKSAKFALDKTPFPYSLHTYEQMMSESVGREWNPSVVHRKLIAPSVSVRQGTVIQPLKFRKVLNRGKADSDDEIEEVGAHFQGIKAKKKASSRL